MSAQSRRISRGSCTLALASTLALACSTTGHLYGPGEVDVPIVLTSGGGDEGTVEGTFPNGEPFTGTYVEREWRPRDERLRDTPWGRIEGMAVLTAGDPSLYVRARSESGLELWCIAATTGGHGTGSCKDSRGRIYELVY